MKRFIIIIVLFVATVVLAGVLIVIPMKAQSNIKSAFENAGFANVEIGSRESIPGGQAYNAITLDDKKSNTIQSVTIRGDSMTIDKLALTGNWETSSLPQIAGWVSPVNITRLASTLKSGNIKTVMLNSGRIDLILPLAGVIGIEAKGQLNILDDGTIRLQAILWSDQKQFKGQINVTGEFSSNGIASLDFEIDDGKLEIPSLSANRLGGWFIFNKSAGTTPWSISAQIVAGMASLYNMPLRGATLSIQGTTQTATINLQSAGMTGETSISIDGKISTYEKNNITATIRTDNLLHLVKSLLSADTVLTLDETGQSGVVIYKSESEKPSELLKDGTFSVSNIASAPWMQGTLRTTESGIDLDIQEAHIKNLATVMGLEKFNTEGKMTGLIPLRQDETGNIIIDQGLMRSTTAGILSFDGKKLPLETSRKNVTDLLKSFAYDRIEFSLFTSKERQVNGNISMTGRPVLNFNQKPTQLNFHFESQL